MSDQFDYLADLFEREIRDGAANPVTGEIEFASVLWEQILPLLEEPKAKPEEPIDDERSLEEVLATPYRPVPVISQVPANEEIAKELAERERRDAAGIARRKPFLDQLRWQLRSPS